MLCVQQDLCASHRPVAGQSSKVHLRFHTQWREGLGKLAYAAQPCPVLPVLQTKGYASKSAQQSQPNILFTPAVLIGFNLALC